MIFWRLQNNHVPRAKNRALFCFPLIVKRCAGDEVDCRSHIIHSNAPMGQSTLRHQGWTITLVLSKKRKIVLKWKHALLPFYLVIAIMTKLLTNKWSTRNSLLCKKYWCFYLYLNRLIKGLFMDWKLQTDWLHSMETVSWPGLTFP